MVSAVLNILLITSLAFLPAEDSLFSDERFLPDLEWSEYEDISEITWQSDNWFSDPDSLETVQTDVVQAASEMKSKVVRKTRDRSGEANGSKLQRQLEVKLLVKADRRFGSATDENIAAYDGSPLGITQKYEIKYQDFHCGLILDKDKYEPEIADLSRFFITRRDETMLLIIGDFNASFGLGATIWSKPVYNFSYGSISSFRTNSPGLSPAINTSVNTALRGIAGSIKKSAFTFDLFGAITMLDAVKSSDGRILRLSGTGLHRSDGENEKKDSVEEKTIGGQVSFQNSISTDIDLKVSAAGYLSEYYPSFQPDITGRDRFPLIGDRAGAGGLSSELIGKGWIFAGEISGDKEGRVAWICKGALRGNESKLGHYSTDVLITAYHFPKNFVNPHAKDFGSGALTQNRTGAALLVIGRIKNSIINNWKTHIEVERSPWRTFTIPSPETKSRASAELEIRTGPASYLTMRYRRGASLDVSEGSNAISDESLDRVRLSWHLRSLSPYIGSLKIWLERASASSRPGVVGGLSCGGRLGKAGTGLDRLRFNLAGSWYRTPGDVYCYIAEASTPGRFASVLVNGRGIRASSSLIYRMGRDRWVSLEIARSYSLERGRGSGDMEAYFSFSWFGGL